MALSAGELIDERYQVIRELGGGGMKLVYLVEDWRLNRKAALADLSDQDAAVASFQRRVDLLAKLDSEYIPRIFERFIANNRHYLVMEYVPGRTLEEWLRAAGGKLDEKFVMDVAAQILDALAYLHGLNPPIRPEAVQRDYEGQRTDKAGLPAAEYHRDNWHPRLCSAGAIHGEA